jgi:hypothetical protein
MGLGAYRISHLEASSSEKIYLPRDSPLNRFLPSKAAEGSVDILLRGDLILSGRGCHLDLAR